LRGNDFCGFRNSVQTYIRASEALAYPVVCRDQDLTRFINTWIELKRRDGTIDALYSHWILGKQTGKRQPRWSVMRHVLHWVD
jgi:ABC-type amino acid transport substrate-binding protein